MPSSTGEGGDIVNQLGFCSLGAISIFSLMAFADPRVVRSLLSPSWMLMLGFFMLSVILATDPPSAMRAASFTLIGILTMATILVLPRDGEAFSKVIIFTAIVVMGLSYLGLIVFPHEAMHTADSQEPEHAGLWRGVFTHKNIAGPIMACFSFAGLYLYRRGQRWWGATIFCAAMIFMLHTGSKTTAGLVPFSILIVVLPSLIGMRLGTPILFAAGNHRHGGRHAGHRLPAAGEASGGDLFSRPDLYRAHDAVGVRRRHAGEEALDRLRL